MFSLQRVRRGVFITLLLATAAVPAHAADPLTLYLLKMLRDQMATSVLESAVNSIRPATARPPAQSALAGVHGVSEEQLRVLAGPKNALARPLIVEELAMKASAVRGAYERLPAQEREQMLQLLQARVAPIPRGLNDLILAEFSTVQRVAEAPAAPVPQ